MSAWPPRHFTGTTAILGAEYYLPVGVHDAIASDVDANGRFPISDRRSRPLILVGRLKPGVTRDQANAQLKVIAAAHEQAYPDDNKNQDPNLPVIFVKSFRAQHEGSAQVWVLGTASKMFLTLGLSGTFVAVIGVYGVRSYLVSRRVREFGVRMAIGASPADVLSLVLRESLAITAVGLTIGLGLAMLLGWGLRVAIYQISPLDPVALGAATGILAIASLAASIIPARRAANVLPMTALRNG